MNGSRINISLLLAALLAAIAESTIAVFYSLKIDGDVITALFSFTACLVLIAAITVPLFIALGFLLNLRSARNLAEIVKGGFGGKDHSSAAIALVVLSLALLISVALSIRLSLIIAGEMTLVFALAVEAIVLILFLSGCLLLAPLLSYQLERLKERLLTKRIGDPQLVAIALVLMAASLFAVVTQLLSFRYAPLPAAVLVGISLGVIPSIKTSIVNFLTKRHIFILTALFAVFVGLVLSTLDFLPGTSKQVLLNRAPYSGTLLGFAHAFFDSDGDGFSSVLLGGDCDDNNPGIHPLALDIPQNGIDEDCSGEDVAKYNPPKVPRFERPAELPEKPNIVLILLDALRPDHLGFNGYSRSVSPNLDAFREDAVLFSRAYSPSPVTQSVMLSFFTGYDFRRLPRKYVGYKRYSVSHSVDTVAERLKRIGYKNIGYTISYVILSAKGLGQGFDVWKTPWPVKEWSMARKKGSVITTDTVIEHLKKIPAEGSPPFFLFVHYYSTHAPYNKYPKWEFGNSDIDKYDSSLAHQDDEMGRLLETLSRRKDKDNTIIFIFSDHGEMLGDHGLTAHGRSLYESDVRVVLMVKLPKIEVSTVNSPVLLTDLAPTILELAQAERNKNGTDGQSLLPYVYREYKNMTRPIFMFTESKVGSIDYNASALVRWPYKYILDRRSQKEEFFNVQKDAAETTNLVSKKRKEKQKYKRLLESFEATLK